MQATPGCAGFQDIVHHRYQCGLGLAPCGRGEHEHVVFRGHCPVRPLLHLAEIRPAQPLGKNRFERLVETGKNRWVS